MFSTLLHKWCTCFYACISSRLVTIMGQTLFHKKFSSFYSSSDPENLIRTTILNPEPEKYQQVFGPEQVGIGSAGLAHESVVLAVHIGPYQTCNTLQCYIGPLEDPCFCFCIGLLFLLGVDICYCLLDISNLLPTTGQIVDPHEVGAYDIWCHSTSVRR